MDIECVVLYTHQKLKKAKTWHDGVLKILTPGTRAILYDDKKTKIDTVHIKPDAIVSGEQLESDRHLILIEEIKTGVDNVKVQLPSGQNGVREHVVQTRSIAPTNNSSVGTGRLSIRAGIKRRKTGFVPPRMIKQPRLDVDESRTDSFESGNNNSMVGSNSSFFTNKESTPDTVSILNLYSRIGAKKDAGNVPVSCKQSVSPMYTSSSSLQSNTDPLVASTSDQRPDSNNRSLLLDRFTCDDSPGRSPQRSSPWTSFGAGRLKGNSNSARNEEWRANELHGAKLNHKNVESHSNIYNETSKFCESDKLLCEKDQEICDKKASVVANSVCTNFDDSQQVSTKISIPASSALNPARKRSASQIMALLGKSRNKEPAPVSDGGQSESQYTVIPQESSVIPICSPSPLECHTENTLNNRPNEHSPSSLECHENIACYPRPNDLSGKGVTTSGKECFVLNNPSFIDYNEVIQDDTSVKTLYNREMHDFSTDLNTSLSSGHSEVQNKLKQPEYKGQQKEFKVHAEHCHNEGDIWEKDRNSGKDTDAEKKSQECVVTVKENLIDKATFEHFPETDLLAPEKTEERNVSEHTIEQYNCESAPPDTPNEETGIKTTYKKLAAVYDCKEKDQLDSCLSQEDFEDDNVDEVQPGSFLISFSPLSQVSNSDDEVDVQYPSTTDVHLKQKTEEDEEFLIKQDQVVDNSQIQHDQVVDNTQIQHDQVVDNSQIQQDQVVDNSQIQHDQVVDNSQIQQDQVVDNSQIKQDQVVDNSQIQHDQVVDNSQIQHDQVVDNSQIQHDQVVDNSQIQHDQVVDNSQIQHDQVVDNSQIQQHQVVDNSQIQHDQVVDNSQIQQHQVVDNSQIQQDQVVDNSQIQHDQVVDPCQIQHDQVVDICQIQQCPVTREPVNSLNDLNFSPDVVSFSSLSSAEDIKESNLNVNSWKTAQKVPGNVIVTDNPRLSISSCNLTNQKFCKITVPGQQSMSKNNLLQSTVMRDITNISPETTVGNSLEWDDKLKPFMVKATSHDFIPSAASELKSEGKPNLLLSRGAISSPSRKLSMLQRSEDQMSQTECGGKTHVEESVSDGVDNISPDLLYPLSENSYSRIQSDSGMPYNCDTIRTIKEQWSLAGPVRSTHYKKPSAITENCNMTEELLPHPSQLLRRPSVTLQTSTITHVDQENPFEGRLDPGAINNAVLRFQQYKVRGSVSGSVARRTSKSGLDYHHRSPSLSVTEDQIARQHLLSSMSPCQTPENTSLLPDQDDHSLFIDCNVGKPQLVDMATLCNTQDIKIPDSPYQHVPTAREPESYEGDSDITYVPDINFGRSKHTDSKRYTSTRNLSSSQCFSDDPVSDVSTPDCDMQNVPSESVSLLCEAESPTYGNMFKKRDMIGYDPDNKMNKDCNNLDNMIVEKTCKEKISLKCKPFGDSFTHTSYTSRYFSPPSVKFKGQKDSPVDVDSVSHMETSTILETKIEYELPANVNFEGQTDTAKHVEHCYYNDSQLDYLDRETNDKNVTREQSVRDECSLDKGGDLHLSLSSVGSSDLELSFTLADYHQSRPKPLVELPWETRLCNHSNTETGDLKSQGNDEFIPTKTYEDNVQPDSNGCKSSKWGKFVTEDDEDDDLLFDDSFNEEYDAKKLGNRINIENISPQVTSVTEPFKMIPKENSSELQRCNDVDKMSVSNQSSSEKLSQSGQKPSVGIGHFPFTEMGSSISQELLDDFDLQNTEDIYVHSRFSKQNTKSDIYIAPSSSTSLTHVTNLNVLYSGSRTAIPENTSTDVSKFVFHSGQSSMKNFQSHTFTPVTEKDVSPPRQNSMKKFKCPVPSAGLVTHVLKGSKRNISGELQFACKEEVDSNPVPLRELSIAVKFPTIATYKQVLTAVLKEHLNIILFGLAQQYHHTLRMADISSYVPAQHPGPLMNKSVSRNQASSNPNCQCGAPAKMIQVKKPGNNKGRFFYTCNSARNKQCKYFQWVDQAGQGKNSTSGSNKLKLCEASSINTYMRGNHLMFYCECELLKKMDFTSHFKKEVPNWVKMKYGQTNPDKKKLYIKLSKKDASSMYSKDDFWIISLTLNFHPTQTFLAKSVYFGPNSANELEIEPLAGFSPSNWPNNAFCHALLAGNIASELCYLGNIEENLSPMSLPILPWILDRSPNPCHRESTQQSGFKAPVRTAVSKTNIFATKTSTVCLEQGSSLLSVTVMFIMFVGVFGAGKLPVVCDCVFGAGKCFLLSVTVMFIMFVGVFGAGKCFLLSVTVMFIMFVGVFGAGKCFLLSVIILFIMFVGVFGAGKCFLLSVTVMFILFVGVFGAGKSFLLSVTIMSIVFVGVFGAGKCFLLSVTVMFIMFVGVFGAGKCFLLSVIILFIMFVGVFGAGKSFLLSVTVMFIMFVGVFGAGKLPVVCDCVFGAGKCFLLSVIILFILFVGVFGAGKCFLLSVTVMFIMFVGVFGAGKLPVVCDVYNVYHVCVFGAGKSFLLSVIVLFLVKLFEGVLWCVYQAWEGLTVNLYEQRLLALNFHGITHLIRSLLDIGFKDFVRVGSMKKISKPVLPFSVHATGSENQELKDLQEMLRSGELTPSEKHNVRQSIEKHRLGENKKRLSKVRVVGVTCASCTASSLDRLTFPVVLLDESSQMTEPASMLPIAKFGCEKLLLVGDPKQLDPTIQGSEAAHTNGLEQTLFDRLIKVGHVPTVLHTQYRCHPVISNIANTLFYDGQLIDGVTSSDRQPLVSEVPTLCFYDVSGGQEQTDDGGSFYNEKEAVFVTSLIQALLKRGVDPASIGVITLYKSQMHKIKTSLLTNIQSDSNKEIKATRVSTVDAFQGGEHDVIILSCVRTNGVGFIDNQKRTNVALTRARHHLLIVGEKSNLSRNQLWSQVLRLCGAQPEGICEADTFLRQLKDTDRDPSQKRMGSTPCSPPMSLSSQETGTVSCSSDPDNEDDVMGPELSPTNPRVLVRKKCRLISADLLESSETSDSEEELPRF
ncbi:LOW QUALITY PROTEIN: uncharacterized protein LOC132559378 [Ylistrum balloti]|uniref:LOW QUALITY PROTEIN: uncharacterized protein LOC132559378 n=1 Tax=Ylistrum balloti TaxID=509963 RepID=UPI002905C6E9|nr:LOW QUALITY PROTEIN: uncharacterized protein LOC132559378 [Ylistrum balloti]